MAKEAGAAAENAAEQVVTRAVLREELAASLASIGTSTLGSDGHIQAVVSRAVAEALAKSHTLQDGRSAHLARLPEVHPWLKVKPLRHNDITEVDESLSQDDQALGMRSVQLSKVHKKLVKAKLASDASSLEARGEGPNASGSSAGAYTPLVTEEPATLTSCKQALRRAVLSEYFERAMLLILVLNAIFVGLETNHIRPNNVGRMCDGSGRNVCDFVGTAELTFCVIFSLELALRLWAAGMRLFSKEGWQINVFDSIVVVLIALDQAVRCLHGGPITRSHMTFLRLLRPIRIARLLRVVHVAGEFREVVASLLNSLSGLFWVFILLSGMIYFFSVYFTEMALEYGSPAHPEYDHLMRRFGHIHLSSLALFEAIFGGISWDEDLQLLWECVSPVAAIALCFYVGFCYTALLNLITGNFVDHALKSAQQAEEMNICNSVARVFFDGDVDRQITWEMFEQKLSHPDMQDYLKAIDVNPTEAQSLFALLDTDDSGSIDVAELINGLLRLKGTTSSLDISLLLREIAHLCDRVEYRMCSRFDSAGSRKHSESASLTI
eukprot:TRINITY_DN14823_c0_g2_i1.p1 TRINITY_DN14823_c0_g2~~TRINITY_DN14823_c0_g2_i1.p1  ORF type:complete len:552 (+),score=77.70 TRINITY_DN14823_c0_g2_i1:121-1776(+)